MHFVKKNVIILGFMVRQNGVHVGPPLWP